MITFSPKHQFILFDSRIFSKTERKKFRDPEDLSPNFHDTEIWPKLFRGSEILSELFRGPEKIFEIISWSPKAPPAGVSVKNDHSIVYQIFAQWITHVHTARSDLSGICLDKITSTFPLYPLAEVEKDISVDHTSSELNKTCFTPVIWQKSNTMGY